MAEEAQQLNVRIPAELYGSLRERSELTDEPVSSIVRNAIAEHLGERLPDGEQIDAVSVRLEQLARRQDDLEERTVVLEQFRTYAMQRAEP